MGEGQDRARLCERLRALAMITGPGIRLASGRTSSIYFDMKMAMFDAETINLIADALIPMLTEEHGEALGGLELGAVPLVAAVVCKSYPERPIRGFFVRKTVKPHGTQKKIEGHFDPALRIVLLDDVTTSGGSVLEAARAVRDAGGTVTTVITVVDREEGATEALAAAGLRLRPVLRKADFAG